MEDVIVIQCYQLMTLSQSIITLWDPLQVFVVMVISYGILHLLNVQVGKLHTLLELGGSWGNLTMMTS